MMRMTLAVLALTLWISPALAEPPAAPKTIDNPEFTHWNKFKVGATSTTRTVIQSGPSKSQIETTSTLKSKAKDKLVVTTQTTMTMTIPGQGEKKMPQPAKDREVPAKMPATGAPYGPGKMPNMPNMPKPDVKEGTETIEAAGKKLACKWVEVKLTMMGNTSHTKTWTSDQVPGETVKMTSTSKSAQMTSSTEITLVSFKTP